MTLKPCKVTQLDDTFWRVDWEGAATVDKDTRRITHSSPRIAEHHEGEWFFCGYWSKSLADALALWGLTAEQPKPETAEARVRAFLAMHNEDTTIMDIGPNARSSLEAADLRAVLAELDRLREELEAAGARWHMLSNERDMLAAKLSEQRLVDVDAVLVPIREARDDMAKRIEYSKECATVASFERRHDDAERAHGRRHAYEDAALELRRALAEAEKIGRVK